MSAEVRMDVGMPAASHDELSRVVNDARDDARVVGEGSKGDEGS